MKRSWLSTLLLIVLFAVFMGTAVRIQHIGVTRIKGNPPFYETWFFRGDRSAELLKVLSLQYDQLAADILWLRAIQSFGGRGMTNRDWKPIYNMFDAITDLDPYFEPAYTFGNMVIGDEGGKQREGLELLRKGTFKVYKGYRIPFEGMYVSHWSLSDSDLARWFGRIAGKRMDAPDWVERITAYIEVQSGEYYIGFDRFVGNLLRALQDEQPPMQLIALTKLKETLDKWNEKLLSEALSQYVEKNGRLPAQIEDLAAMPALQNYETASMDRLVNAVERVTKTLGKNGLDPEFLKDTPRLLAAQQAALVAPTGETTATSLLDFQNDVFRGSLVTRSGIPEDPEGIGYVLNHTLLGDPEAKTEDKFMNRKELELYLHELLGNLRSAIEERKQELGRNPKDLAEVFHTEFLTKEPFGGEWLYNAELGELKASSHPEF